MCFSRKKKTTIRTVMKSGRGTWHVFRLSVFGNWRIESHGYRNSTSAWAELGKLAFQEQVRVKES